MQWSFCFPPHFEHVCLFPPISNRGKWFGPNKIFNHPILLLRSSRNLPTKPIRRPIRGSDGRSSPTKPTRRPIRGGSGRTIKPTQRPIHSGMKIQTTRRRPIRLPIRSSDVKKSLIRPIQSRIPRTSNIKNNISNRKTIISNPLKIMICNLSFSLGKKFLSNPYKY